MDKRHSYTETLIHSQCISDIVRAKFVKESQKKSLSRHPQGHRPRLFAFDRKSTFILTISSFQWQTRKHTGQLISAAYRAEKQHFSTLITTYFPLCLSAWMRRKDTLQFQPENFACRNGDNGGTKQRICAAHHCQGRSPTPLSISYSGS